LFNRGLRGIDMSFSSLYISETGWKHPLQY
jgi:hypothetical protein